MKAKGKGVLATRWAFALPLFLSLALTGCKITYSGEEFNLEIGPNGQGHLKVMYKNFGSAYAKSHERSRDLDMLKGAPRDPGLEKKAQAVGVTLITRRLELVNFSMNGFVEAEAASFPQLFDFFTNYRLEADDKNIYIIPLIGKVLQATYNEAGTVVERDGRVAFAWPKGTTSFAFKATYKNEGATFQYDLQKKYTK